MRMRKNLLSLIKSKKGETIVEVVISLLIFSMVVAAVATIIIVASNIGKSASQKDLHLSADITLVETIDMGEADNTTIIFKFDAYNEPGRKYFYSGKIKETTDSGIVYFE